MSLIMPKGVALLSSPLHSITHLHNTNCLTMTKRSSLFLIACAVIGATFLFVDESTVQSLRRLGARNPPFMKRGDDNQMCSGPRREINNHHRPFYEQANYALHVGHSVSNGHVNDDIIILFNAIDTAMNSGNRTVVVVSNWAEEFLDVFFPDEESWDRATRDLPIARVAEAKEMDLMPLLHTSVAMFIRGAAQLKELTLWHQTHARRLNFLHYLFSSLLGEPCHVWHELVGYMSGKYESSKYIAVMIRHPKGGCSRFNHDHHEQCEMSSTYIKKILEPTGLYGKLPIVLLGDMKDEPKLQRLQSQLREVVVPKWDMGIFPSILADIAIAGMSEIFIGNEGSSMSRNVGVVREAFGKDVHTNYVFVNMTENGMWESLIPHYPYDWANNEIDGNGDLWP